MLNIFGKSAVAGSFRAARVSKRLIPELRPQARFRRRMMLPPLPPVLQPVEIQINHRGRIQSQHLTHDQSPDNRDPQRAPQFRPRPVPSASGSAPSIAAIVVIRIGRRRSMHASKIASREFLPSSRSAASAKSIIMIAFFFTMPISKMMPIIAIIVRSVCVDRQRQERAHACRRKRGKNRDGMNVAFVENPQHQINRDQRGCDQHRFFTQRILIRLRRSRENRVNGGSANRSFRPRRLDIVHGLSQRYARREIERNRDRGKQSLVINRQRGGLRLVARSALSGTWLPDGELT